MSLAPVDRTDTLADVVYAQLRDAIAARSLAAGSRLTEAGVAAQLGVSKTPVREALLRLRQVGLIEPEGLRGNRVIAGSAREMRDAFEARLALEGFAADAAAERAPAAVLELIADIAERSLTCARVADLEGFLALDREFHVTLARASGNGRVAKLIEDTATLVRVLRETRLPDAARVVASAAQHVEIARVLAQRDGAAARQGIQEHLATVEALFDASEA